MAVTIAIVERNVTGGAYEAIVDVTGPASYTTGGETLTVAQQTQVMPQFGVPSAVDFTKVTYFHSEKDAAGRTLSLDKTNNKMLFFGAGAEIAGATNLSAVTVRARVSYGYPM